jgi:hypothetical protein
VSVTYDLKPLFPVERPIEGVLGLFTVVAEPTPPWLAVSGRLVFAALAEPHETQACPSSSFYLG